MSVYILTSCSTQGESRDEVMTTSNCTSAYSLTSLENPEVFEVTADKKINLENLIEKPDPKVRVAFQMQQHKVL